MNSEERFLSTDEVVLAVYDDFKTIEPRKKEVAIQIEDNLSELAQKGDIQKRIDSKKRSTHWAAKDVSDHEFI